MATRIRRINVTQGGNQSAMQTRGRSSKGNGKTNVESSSSEEESEEEDVENDESDVVEDDAEADESSMSELSDETDEEMDESKKSDEAGSEDAESLLGSADSEDMGADLEEEEERFIIEDLARRRAKVEARRRKEGDTVLPDEQRAIAEVLNEANEDKGQASAFPDDASGSLSPETLHQLGLDELLEGPDGFHSSSEPSFTDFFGSDSEDGTEDGIVLDARSDDQQLTTDDEDDDSETDISDLENGFLSAPYLGEALAAGAGTQITPGGEQHGQADIPLLVIEDLDGRLIYARAGDGEAVFGSDGEFEFVDDSEDDSEFDRDSADEYDDDDDIVFHMDGVRHPRGRSGWHLEKHNRWQSHDDEETDEGDTTDELPNEDMPFPRLLVGSVAPHGGRNARRARALAARSRRISPNTATTKEGRKRSRSATTTSNGFDVVQPKVKQCDATSIGIAVQDVNYSISTDELARDPRTTLETAAQELGLTVDEVARLVLGIKVEDNEAQSEQGQATIATPTLSNNRALPSVVTPDNGRRTVNAPQMGSFMPTSSKSVHRAVIDGSRQAPSPFANRYGTQKKGLASRKRLHSHSTPSVKRARRNDVERQTSALATDTSENETDTGGFMSTSMRDGADGNDEDDEAMGLDDVMDATLLWRGSHPSSPPAPSSGGANDEKGSAGKKSPSLRGSAAAARRSPGASSSSGSPNKAQSGGSGGLNLNAVARWHRISMGAFREGQEASSTARQQPLGMFLLTRSRNGHGGKGGPSSSRNAGSGRSGNAEHSPFRGRARGASIHLNEAPKPLSRDSFMVSPVLWPTKHGNAENGVPAHSYESGATSAAAVTTADARQGNTVSFGNGQTTNARKMTTRREKRERKARKAALKSALRNGAHSTFDGDAIGAGSPLPDGFLPHLDVTRPSPRPSPLTDHGSRSASANDGEQKDRQPSSSSLNTSTTTTSKNATPIDIPTLDVRGSHAQASQALLQGTSIASNSSSSMSSQHQPPSSVFGMPLHSPLFGSVLDPPSNLGFRDDLDERDEEGVLTI